MTILYKTEITKLMPGFNGIRHRAEDFILFPNSNATVSPRVIITCKSVDDRVQFEAKLQRLMKKHTCETLLWGGPMDSPTDPDNLDDLLPSVLHTPKAPIKMKNDPRDVTIHIAHDMPINDVFTWEAHTDKAAGWMSTQMHLGRREGRLLSEPLNAVDSSMYQHMAEDYGLTIKKEHGKPTRTITDAKGTMHLEPNAPFKEEGGAE